MYLDFLNKNLDIDIIYSIRNGYSIKIITDDKIELRIGKKINEKELYDILYKHKRFLINHLDGSHKKNNNKIHLLGKEYDLFIIKSDFDNILINDINNEFKVYTKDLDESYIRYQILKYYENVLIDILNKYNDKIKKDLNINFDVNFKFKYVKTYYGECLTKKRIIYLSLNLAKYELKYILSVIYHEYTHFYVNGHQDKFYKLIESVFKDYKKTQKELRRTKYQDLY